MVGHAPLERGIKVRILVRQPDITRGSTAGIIAAAVRFWISLSRFES